MFYIVILILTCDLADNPEKNGCYLTVFIVYQVKKGPVVLDSFLI